MKTPPTRTDLLEAERFAQKLASGQRKPMQRRVFLKLSGFSLLPSS